ncbi:MAG: hypothetical protein H0X25_21665 [Acidobacteriales bacterium]|nr:hypothetical protein [Terriglobales bacterium]
MTPRPAKPDLSPPAAVKTWQRWSLMVGGAATILVLIGAFLQPDQFFRAYLFNYMDWLGIALGSSALLMIRHLTKGAWGMVVRRVWGAAMRTVPLLTLMFIPILFGIHRLYPWSWPDSALAGNKALLEHVQHIRGYMNVPGFIARAVLYFAVWNAISFLLTKWSREQDRPPVRDNARFKKLSAPGLILYAFTISFAAIDWLMLLDPTWNSTMYPLILLAGQLIAAICFVIVIERLLVDYKPMSELLKPDYVHDHGKLTLAFIMLWAYFSFSQWLIIWAGNLPEEISWYLRRLNGGWQYCGLILFVFGFALPFLTLLSRPYKRNVRKLAYLAVWLLVMRWLDLLWIVEPNFSKTFSISWLDVVMPFAMGGLWLAYFFRNLASMELVPAYDVLASEVLEPVHEG